MIKFESILEKFGKQGEKTGWTYLFIPFDIAEKINAGVKKSYRVKGQIDEIEFSQIALSPMGEGNFILPLKEDLRKQIKKPIGEKVILKIEVDLFDKPVDKELMDCIEDDKLALKYFSAMPKSHQKYYSNYVEAAKTEETKAKRIVQIVISVSKGMNYAEMIRANKKEL